MKFLHGLTIYQNPRNAIFRQETGLYDLKQGPIREEVTVTVIGEDDHCYIINTFISDRFMLKPGICIYGQFTYGVGFHKTRLVRFVETKLKMIY